MNYSKQRELILDTLKDNVVHPTAEYLYSIIKKKDSSISLATLYRNLNLLAANGMIKKIDGLESSSHFDHNVHEHYHFMCDKCKRVYDVSYNVAPDIIRLAEDEIGADITSCEIVFHGVCNECKVKEKIMDKYVCTVCNYVYDPAENDNVKFEDLPEDYVCPICGVGKDLFEKE